MDRNNAQHKSLWSELRGVSFEQGYLDAGGIRTRYLAAGDVEKPLVILIHGTGGHAEAYSRNLAAHARHFRTYSIDLVGHGWSDKPPISYEIADYARHVIDVIKALGYKKTHISGESLGGWVAAWIARYHQEWVDRLVLNTAGGWTAYPEVMERIRSLTMEAVTDPTPERIRSRLEFLMYRNTNVNDDLVETRRAIYAQPGYADTMKRILCLQEIETRKRNMFSAEDSQKITAPTLVIWTSHDPTATPEEGKKIARSIPGAQFELMTGCGHWPQFEDPETFNRIHLDFLRKL